MAANDDGAKSFVAYYSWWDVIGRLDEHQQALILQAMFATGGVCDVPELDFVAEIAFIPIEREIKANLEKWEETREKRREAGRKGGKASRKTAKNEEQANEANAYFAKQDQAKVSNAKQSQANQAIDIDIDKKEMSPTKVDDRALDDEKAKERAIEEEKAKERTKKAQETKKAKEHFEEIWALYPVKKGKNLISDKRKRDLLSVSVEEMERFIKRYKRDIEADHNNGFARQWLNGSTWFNGRWQDYTDDNYQPAPKIKAIGKGKEYRYMSNEENRDFSHLEE